MKLAPEVDFNVGDGVALMLCPCSCLMSVSMSMLVPMFISILNFILTFIVMFIFKLLLRFVPFPLLTPLCVKIKNPQTGFTVTLSARLCQIVEAKPIHSL